MSGDYDRDAVYLRYCQLKGLLPNWYKIENGYLVPIDQDEIDKINREIQAIEKVYPKFNFDI